VAEILEAVVTGVLAYGIGKFLNAHMAKEDGAKEQAGDYGGRASAGQYALQPGVAEENDRGPEACGGGALDQRICAHRL
jgi:hypothetical protein